MQLLRCLVVAPRCTAGKGPCRSLLPSHGVPPHTLTNHQPIHSMHTDCDCTSNLHPSVIALLMHKYVVLLMRTDCDCAVLYRRRWPTPPTWTAWTCAPTASTPPPTSPALRAACPSTTSATVGGLALLDGAVGGAVGGRVHAGGRRECLLLQLGVPAPCTAPARGLPSHPCSVPPPTSLCRRRGGRG